MYGITSDKIGCFIMKTRIIIFYFLILLFCSSLTLEELCLIIGLLTRIGCFVTYNIRQNNFFLKNWYNLLLVL
jgi:hypothetical protein